MCSVGLKYARKVVNFFEEKSAPLAASVAPECKILATRLAYGLQPIVSLLFSLPVSGHARIITSPRCNLMLLDFIHSLL